MRCVELETERKIADLAFGAFDGSYKIEIAGQKYKLMKNIKRKINFSLK